MSANSFATASTLHRVTANARRRPSDDGCYVPGDDPPFLMEQSGGLAVRIALMIVAVVALAAFAAFGIAV